MARLYLAETSLLLRLVSALIPFNLFASKSTDFDVHQNWLAITYSLPLQEWYFEATSKWTLDYPPFFAYFEWLMAQVAALVDPMITTISKDPYRQQSCVVFQRVTVIVTDLFFCYACLRICEVTRRGKKQAQDLRVPFILCYINLGLFLVDNIHFQYNSVLFGLLLLSISFIFEVSLFLFRAVSITWSRANFLRAQLHTSCFFTSSTSLCTAHPLSGHIYSANWCSLKALLGAKSCET